MQRTRYEQRQQRERRTRRLVHTVIGTLVLLTVAMGSYVVWLDTHSIRVAIARMMHAQQ